MLVGVCIATAIVVAKKKKNCAVQPQGKSATGAGTELDDR